MSAPSADLHPPPSERQLEFLLFLVKYIEEHGYQPSQKEIAAALGVTKSAIQGRLQELARRGIVDMGRGKTDFEKRGHEKSWGQTVLTWGCDQRPSAFLGRALICPRPPRPERLDHRQLLGRQSRSGDFEVVVTECDR